MPGVTTSSDVRNIFGNPDYTSNGSDGGTYWSYSEQNQASTENLIKSAADSVGLGGAIATAGINALNASPKSRLLDVFFQNNLVTSYSITERK